MRDKIYRHMIQRAIEKIVPREILDERHLYRKLVEITYPYRFGLRDCERFFDYQLSWDSCPEGWSYWWSRQVLLTILICRFHLMSQNQSQFEYNLDYLASLLTDYANNTARFDRENYGEFKHKACNIWQQYKKTQNDIWG